GEARTSRPRHRAESVVLADRRRQPPAAGEGDRRADPPGRAGRHVSALMASLAEHRRDIGVPAYQVADALGVHPSQLSHWERGTRGLRWPSVLAYAAAVHRRIVVWRDGVLARGEDLPGALPGL